ncbi:MAG: hypothetical protein KJ607_02545 [Bacteroidetes bacterium]|nr:hypothetical protein [Bacteroidota bacterium]
MKKFDLSENKREDLNSLSHQILCYSNNNIPRISFLRDVAHLVSGFIDCDVIELWLKKEGNELRYEVTRLASDFFSINNISYKNAKYSPESHNNMYVERISADIINNFTDAYTPYITKGGSFFLSGPDDPITFGTAGKEARKSADIITGTSYRTILITPFRVGEERIGAMGIFNAGGKFYTEKDVELIEVFAQTIGIALLNHYKQAALNERIKELTCLYGMSRIGELSNISIKELIKRVLDLLPPAWQYPDITHARIVFDDREYTTEGLTVEADILVTDIIIDKKKRGHIEVIYTEKQPELDEGPFLKEERSLIETITKQLALIIEQKETEEAKESLQKQLWHADRLATVGELSAGVAHELNEPLGTILGFAQLIEKNSSLSKVVRKDIEKIINSSLHAREIVKKLMFFARQMPPNKTQINLNHVVEDGLYFLESRCAKEGIRLMRSLDEDLPDIIADPIQLNQVIVNLVVNAIQAMQNGGILEIKTIHTKKYISLFIKDNGIGMTKEVMPHIFEPFFSTKEIGKGTGLGLSVVHGIITSHNGKINIHSEAGKGTCFEIQLPVASYNG